MYSVRVDVLKAKYLVIETSINFPGVNEDIHLRKRLRRLNKY